MGPRSDRFIKYDERGAYHWASCDRSARTYEPATEARYAVLAKRMGGATRILDVGCGDGYLLSLASRHAATAVGIDTERTAIVIASGLLKDYANSEVVLGSSFALPFASGSFDVVALADVIEHLEDPERCVGEIGRVLSKEGRALVTTPQWRPGKMWDAEHHVKEYKPEELVELLEPFFGNVSLSLFISSRWWQVRRRLGKGFIRSFSRLFYNPFVREGAEPHRFVHMLAVCERPRQLSRNPVS